MAILGDNELFTGKIPSELKYSSLGFVNFRGKLRTSVSPRISRIIKGLKDPSGINRELSNSIDEILREAISSSIWVSRNDGNVDIIDSGELLNSQEVSNTSNGLRISYSVPYANLIHYGGYIVPYGNTNASRVYIPPRPWVTNVLSGQFRGFDLQQAYGQIISRLLS